MTMNLTGHRGFLKTGAAALAAALLAGGAAWASPAGDPPGAGILDVFHVRRSVRNFKPDAVPDADITRILDAARTAPCSGNQQPWKFLVVRDRGRINEMMEVCVKRAMDRFESRGDKATTREQYEAEARAMYRGYFSAPVYIVVLTDNNSMYPGYNHWDGPMAAGYLMLAARALGYGTVFITDSVPESVTRQVLHIPDRYTRVCVTPLGVPVEWPKSPPKKELGDFIAYEAL
jgi:nitroreductase